MTKNTDINYYIYFIASYMDLNINIVVKNFHVTSPLE